MSRVWGLLVAAARAADLQPVKPRLQEPRVARSSRHSRCRLGKNARLAVLPNCGQECPRSAQVRLRIFRCRYAAAPDLRSYRRKTACCLLGRVCVIAGRRSCTAKSSSQARHRWILIGNSMNLSQRQASARARKTNPKTKNHSCKRTGSCARLIATTQIRSPLAIC